MRVVDRIVAAMGGALLGLSLTLLTGCGAVLGLDDYRNGASSTVNGDDAGGASGGGANGGSAGAIDQGGSEGGKPLRVFVTSTTYTGALGEDVASAIANANNECQLRAEAGNLGGTWVAWLTNEGRIDMHELDRFGPWHLPRSGAIAVESIATMMDCRCLGTAILEDEMGPLGPNPEPLNVWTGTDSADAASVDVDPLTDNCDHWTTEDPTYKGVFGALTAANPAWTYLSNTACSERLRLYCFEVP